MPTARKGIELKALAIVTEEMHLHKVGIISYFLNLWRYEHNQILKQDLIIKEEKIKVDEKKNN
jgi:hypothetical protein